MSSNPPASIHDLAKLFTPDEVAALFRISKATLNRLVETRQIPFPIEGRGKRFTEEELRRFLALSRVEPITRRRS